MSDHGRIERDADTALDEVLDVAWVARHRGSTADFLKRYRRVAAAAATKRLPGLRAIAPDMVALISDERTLHAAWDHLARHGGDAPGPDGCTYTMFSPSEVWGICRGLRDDIRAGQYRPGGDRLVRIPKGPGRGYRTLALRSIFDRVVERAAVEVLQPLLDPLFVSTSFGYRPGRGPLHALAHAARLYHQGARVWVAADIRDAFPSVPVGRLVGVVRHYLPDDTLVGFLETVLRSAYVPGLRQGSPCSPLMLNLYLHHLVDRPWRARHPQMPLVRFADDLLLPCRTARAAVSAYSVLATLLTRAGFELKESRRDAVRAVGAGAAVTWMGYAISGAGGDLRYDIPAAGWGQLAEAFARAHEMPHPPIRAVQALAGWIDARGPCLPAINLRRAYDRIKGLAEREGFEEILDRHEVTMLWRAAYARWCRLRTMVATGGPPADGAGVSNPRCQGGGRSR